MTNSGITKVFETAVLEADLSMIRTCITEKIYADPRFETGTYEKYMNYVKQHGLSITDPYCLRPDEFDLPKEAWNESFFNRSVEWFRLNFAPEERVPKLKQVGRQVFPEHKPKETPTEKKQPTTFHVAPAGRKGETKKPSWILLLGLGIAAVAAIIYLLKKL